MQVIIGPSQLFMDHHHPIPLQGIKVVKSYPINTSRPLHVSEDE